MARLLHQIRANGLERTRPPGSTVILKKLLDFAPALFPIAFAGQSLLYAFLLARFQIEGVTLDLFNDVLSLNLPLEAAQGVLYRFALLQFYFCQLKIHPQTDHKFTSRPIRKVLISYVFDYESQDLFASQPARAASRICKLLKKRYLRSQWKMFLRYY